MLHMGTSLTKTAKEKDFVSNAAYGLLMHESLTNPAKEKVFVSHAACGLHRHDSLTKIQKTKSLVSSQVNLVLCRTSSALTKGDHHKSWSSGIALQARHD